MSYKTVLKEESIENEIKKSKFMGYIYPVSNEEEAIEYIDNIKRIHPSARHHCFAYIVGENKNIQRYSDDGEPSGTAGIPMLEILKKKDLTDICIVVVRYFGGILLGAGGLVRAYAGACNDVCNKATLVEKKEFRNISITVDYNNYGRVLNYIEDNEIHVNSKVFEENVVLEIYIENKYIDKFNKNLLDLTSGNITIVLNDILLLKTKNNKLLIEE